MRMKHILSFASRGMFLLRVGTFAFVAALLSVSGGPVFAVDCDAGYEEMAGVCVPLTDTVGLTDREPGQVVATVMLWLMSIVGILAILMFVVAGIMYLTAAGDESKTTAAKNIIRFAITGVAVALMGYVIVYTVEQLVTDGATESNPY